MADIRATKNGNWSDATVWTPNPPAAGDVVRPNNFTVTIDIDVTVTEIRNDAGGGAVLGGFFNLSDGVNVTATNGFYGQYQNISNQGVLVYSGTGTTTVNGDLYGAQINVSLGSCLLINSSGTVIVNGNLNTVNIGPNASGIRLTSTGTIILNGNVVHINSGLGIRNNEGNGTVIVNGDISTNSGTAIANTSGTVTITGDLTSSGGLAISNTSGTITIIGDLTITGTGGITAISSSGGVINFIGNATTGIPINSLSQNCFSISGGILNVTGNIITRGTGGQSNATATRGILLTSTGTVNITGTVNGPDFLFNTAMAASQALQQLAHGVDNFSSGVVNIIGNCIGQLGYTQLTPLSRVQYNAVTNRSTGTINITGNVLGGSNGVAVGNSSTGTINITGDVIGGQLVSGVVNTSTGTVDVTGAVEGGVSYSGIENDNVSANVKVQKIRFGANGQTATRGYIKFKNTVNIAAETVLKTDATTTNLVDINVVPNLQPAISDVRLGVTYSSGSLTGTMNVPPFNAVKAGVPVDNGVGTAALTPQDVWNVLISGLTQSGSIGERLKNVATVETTGTQIASFNV